MSSACFAPLAEHSRGGESERGNVIINCISNSRPRRGIGGGGGGGACKRSHHTVPRRHPEGWLGDRFRASRERTLVVVVVVVRGIVRQYTQVGAGRATREGLPCRIGGLACDAPLRRHECRAFKICRLLCGSTEMRFLAIGCEAIGCGAPRGGSREMARCVQKEMAQTHQVARGKY